MTARASFSDDAAARCASSIRAIVRALRIDSRAIELAIGLTFAQLLVLQELDEREARSLRELAQRTTTHPSSVSVLVKRLVERGLVSRVAEGFDHRCLRLALTPAGRTIVRSAPMTVHARLIGGLRQLDPVSREVLAVLLEHWVTESGIDLVTAPAIHADATDDRPQDDRIDGDRIDDDRIVGDRTNPPRRESAA